MESINSRISEVVKYHCKTNKEFCSIFGRTKQWVSNITKEGFPVGATTIKEIVSKFPEVNANWLLTGDGEMLKKGEMLTKERLPSTTSVFKQESLFGVAFNIYGTIDNPLFLAKNVAEWIGHSNVTDMISRIDSSEVTKLNLGGLQGECNFLTEDGLYEVLMQSRKPIAKQFKKGIKEILKSIRKHGAYLTPQKIEEVLLNPDTIIQLATNLKDEQQRRLFAESKIEELTPKAEYTDNVLTCANTVSITQIAKDYGMTGVALNKKLNLMGVIYKVNNQWVLYKRHEGNGYTKSVTYYDGYGRSYIRTEWTQRGRKFIDSLIRL